MKAAEFEHHEPETVDRAVSLIESLDEPTILAGGQSLVPMLRFRLARPDTVVDINGIDSLDYLHEDDGYLKIAGPSLARLPKLTRRATGAASCSPTTARSLRRVPTASASSRSTSCFYSPTTPPSARTNSSPKRGCQPPNPVKVAPTTS